MKQASKQTEHKPNIGLAGTFNHLPNSVKHASPRSVLSRSHFGSLKGVHPFSLLKWGSPGKTCLCCSPQSIQDLNPTYIIQTHFAHSQVWSQRNKIHTIVYLEQTFSASVAPPCVKICKGFPFCSENELAPLPLLLSILIHKMGTRALTSGHCCRRLCEDVGRAPSQLSDTNANLIWPTALTTLSLDRGKALVTFLTFF